MDSTHGIKHPGRVGLALILGLTVILYVNAMDNAFHYDDFHTVVQNPSIRSLDNLSLFFTDSRTASEHPEATSFRPLTTASYAVNYALGGLDPRGYHLLNLLLHLGTVLLSYRLFSVALNQRYAVFFATLVFAIHPLHTETINYITARSTLLSTFFSLLAVIGVLEYCRMSEKNSRMVRRLILAGLTGALMLAFFSKETALMTPALLILAYLCFHPARDRKRMLQIGFLLLAGLIFLGVYIWIRQDFFSLFFTHLLGNEGLVLSLLTSLVILTKYLQFFFWPVGLAIEHDLTRAAALSDPNVQMALSILLLLAFLGWRVRSERILQFCSGWYLLSLAPVCALPFFTQEALFQENRGYQAMIALALCSGWIVQNLRDRKIPQHRILWSAGVVVLALVLSLGVSVRNTVWKDGVTLWSDAVIKSPRSAVAHTNLASAYHQADRPLESMEMIRKAIRLDPREPASHALLGLLEARQGHWENAVESYQAALRFKPDAWKIHMELGVALSNLGRYEESIAHHRNALEGNPRHWKIHHNLVHAHWGLEALDVIRLEYQQALGAHPGEFSNHYALALVYRLSGSAKEALKHYEEAIRIDPTVAEAHDGLCELLAEGGQWDRATMACQRFQEADPQDPRAYRVLGYIREVQGEFELAIRSYQEGLKIDPSDAEMQFNLGNIYWSRGEWERALQFNQAALQSHPGFIRARFVLAGRLAELGKTGQAVSHYRRVIADAGTAQEWSIAERARKNLAALRTRVDPRLKIH